MCTNQNNAMAPIGITISTTHEITLATPSIKSGGKNDAWVNVGKSNVIPISNFKALDGI
jgi:hypothetical protein